MGSIIAERAVVGASASASRKWDRPVAIPSHSEPPHVADALLAFRRTCIKAWRAATRRPHPAYRPTEQETQPFRDMLRPNEQRWPSVPRLMSAIIALRDPNAWETLAAWCYDQRAQLHPQAPLTIAEAWDLETHCEAPSDIAVRKALLASDPATIDGAIEAVEDEIAAGYGLRNALQRRKAELLRQRADVRVGRA